MFLFRPALRSFRAVSRIATRLSSTSAEGPYKDISVGPDEKLHVGKLTFVEEPLGLPAKEHFGWPHLEFNESIGPDNRYVISRKLGWGMPSSTWLARDKIENSYVALKILNGHHTSLVEQNLVWELKILERVSSPSPHCLDLMSHFTFPGKGQRRTAPLPRHQGPRRRRKTTVLETRRGVVHTDVKHDNIFFDTPLSTDHFDALVASDPPRRHPPEASHDGLLVQAAVSQPLPLPTLQEAMQLNFLLADFGSAQPLFIQTQNEISAPQLRPPEIMIGGPWDVKVDIWAFGCLIFELITGRGLFKYEPDLRYNLDEPNFMLYQMICYTGEDFRAEQLSVSPLAAQFFDSTCNLKANPPLFDYPFETSIRSYKVVEEADVLSTAAFMRRCLCLDPTKRASAAELLSDPWFDGVEWGRSTESCDQANVLLLPSSDDHRTRQTSASIGSQGILLAQHQL
ncbi:kinase-like protein [Armillaria borealis]|uniref:non-specific serine/threonine protein kinase n=1 Tax=Armillaria borealis TaxID=47425 RepID=A0AA39JYV3_9AGAR|nr:kinase-like protein [Armillaria borealis]